LTNHFKITLAYDGTDFVGWQRQAAGTSIQGLLEEALTELDGRHVAVAAASRTDAGVHALGQVAGFSLARSISTTSLLRALNTRLPGAVRVISAEEAAPEFHARFGRCTKSYRYRIWNEDIISPFERRYAWHVMGRLDVDAMDAAARLLEGHHDFSAFQAAGGSRKTTDRLVTSSRVSRQAGHEPLLVYEVAGTGFLRHMVRTIVGTLVEIGHGRQAVAWMGDALASRDRRQAGPTAPAEGLFLVGVVYN
jgi:tRNA pseudouridine38-40 synthase